MKLYVELFLTILQIFNSNCEKKFLKMDKCEVNEKFAVNERCEVIDGRSFVVYKIIEPINECLVEVCMQKSKNSKFHQVGKCQNFNRCEYSKPGASLNQITKRIANFFKISGIQGSLSSCLIVGYQKFLNISIGFSNLLTFLPRGVLRISVRNYNMKNGLLFETSAVILNK
ncbi:hypothetical protein ACKWTF_014292 [Chironomus riparius]